MGSTITMKERRGILIVRLNCGSRLGSEAAGIFAVAISSQGNHENERNDAPPKGLPLSPTTGFTRPAMTYELAIWTQNVLCSFLSILVDFDLKRETFAESRALTVPWKGRNVGEHLRTALRGRDESEAPIIIPLCESAFDAHLKGLKKVGTNKGLKILADRHITILIAWPVLPIPSLKTATPARCLLV